MLTMGFTNVYYTLWEVDKPFERYNIHCSSKELVQPCSYMQNLSKDYEKALAKIKERAAGSKFDIDLDLKGEHSFDRILSSEKVDPFEQWQFSFGKLAGQDIRIATDIWQLNRAMKEEKSKRRRVHARRRLIELGEIVRNPFRTSFDDTYINPAHLRYLREKANNEAITGHFYENGKRVTVNIKRVGGAHYETKYGYIYIEKYITDDGKPLKYKGSSPLDVSKTRLVKDEFTGEYFNEIVDEFVTVTATVEHDVYNNLPETRLKRLKLAPQKNTA